MIFASHNKPVNGHGFNSHSIQSFADRVSVVEVLVKF
jgi:hypothetical protein